MTGASGSLVLTAGMPRPPWTSFAQGSRRGWSGTKRAFVVDQCFGFEFLCRFLWSDLGEKTGKGKENNRPIQLNADSSKVKVRSF